MDFFKMDPSSPVFFGFPEFLTALALFAIVWTISDVRYKLRTRLAPVEFERPIFFAIVIVGFLVLATDVWRASGWLVPSGILLTPETWQGLLALLVLSIFPLWIWFSFLRRPKYTRMSSENFSLTIYRAIVKGNQAEIGILADELAPTTRQMLQTKSNVVRNEKTAVRNDKLAKPDRFYSTTLNILLLFGDARFCRAVVDNAPHFAMWLFINLRENREWIKPLRAFSRNVVQAALSNPDSFIFHEKSGYESGAIGHWKPVVDALFGDWQLVEQSDGLMRLDYRFEDRLDSRMWEAYLNALRLTIANACEKPDQFSSEFFSKMLDIPARTTFDFTNMGPKVSRYWEHDAYQRLRVALDFIKYLLEQLDRTSYSKRAGFRHQANPSEKTIYDRVAEVYCGIVRASTAFRENDDQTWSVQHNLIWTALFGRGKSESRSTELVRFKVRRIIYEEVKSIETFPNYSNTAYLGYCLNVLGLNTRPRTSHSDSFPLEKAVQLWTRSNFSKVYAEKPALRERLLVGTVSYNETAKELYKMYAFYEVDGQSRDVFPVM